mmetsp:Transcript_38864/g.79604  ORF Transcript_38864/g.79604 Transcript_38864/m.79604 type:complete len:205 (+) Transcript_38864:165-779(+)
MRVVSLAKQLSRRGNGTQTHWKLPSVLLHCASPMSQRVPRHIGSSSAATRHSSMSPKDNFGVSWNISELSAATYSHGERSWLNDNACANIAVISVTARTSHAEISWLNECAALNMLPMSDTLLVSQALMSELNCAARRNMEFIFVTLLVSQAESSWLIGVPSKALAISVTELVFHAPIGWLNDAAFEKTKAMSVVELVSHLPMF